MTNEAIAAILEYLSTEVRNSKHTALGFSLVRSSHERGSQERSKRAGMSPLRWASADACRASADELLRSIDDIGELLSDPAPGEASLEEFDLASLARQAAELMNLASGRKRQRIAFVGPDRPLQVTQDRRALEQVATRVFGTALKLARGAGLHASLTRQEADQVRLAIRTRDRDLSGRLVKWLNATIDTATLREPNDLPLGVAVMLAGKRMRALGGSAQEILHQDGRASVAIDVPCLAKDAASNLPQPVRGMDTDALSVLVAEDCDESFFLTELTLEGERVHRAHDGSEALRFIKKKRFDMVLMDVHMPGMDGYSTIRSIRDWETQTGNARTPLVVLSSDDLETQKRSAAESGCSGFLRKPLRRSDIDGLIERLKQSRRLMI
jgi:CheY-like chemotaxis protein